MKKIKLLLLVLFTLVTFNVHAATFTIQAGGGQFETCRLSEKNNTGDVNIGVEVLDQYKNEEWVSQIALLLRDANDKELYFIGLGSESNNSNSLVGFQVYSFAKESPALEPPTSYNTARQYFFDIRAENHQVIQLGVKWVNEGFIKSYLGQSGNIISKLTKDGYSVEIIVSGAEVKVNTQNSNLFGCEKFAEKLTP